MIITFLAVLSFSSNYLNSLGSQNWKLFASKNYFDKEGSFILLFLNLPIFVEVIISMFLILILSITGNGGCCKNCKCGKKNNKVKAGSSNSKKEANKNTKKSAKVNKKKIN